MEGRSFMEHDDRIGGGFHTKKKKGRGPFRAKMYSEQSYRPRYRGGGGPPPPRSRLEDRDGDISMNDTLETPRNRYNPYGQRPQRHGADWSAHDQSGPSNIHVTVRRDMPPQDQRGGGAKEFNKNWYKITIPQGRKYEKNWLLSSIQSTCSVPFIPIEFHFERLRAEFYVEGKNVANALQQISRKITDKDGFKVVLLSQQSGPPPGMHKGPKDLKDEDIVQLKLCMSRRYDGALQALDLKNLRADAELLTQGVVLVLSKRSYMEAVLRIIEENIPELLALNLSDNKIFRLEDMVDLPQKAPLLKHLNLSGNELKTERELDRLKGMKLEELVLDGNPLCDSFRDQSTYISAIRERFPKLLRLDGHDLPPPIAFDVETPTTLPPLRGSYFGSDEIKVLVLRFVHQYYAVYDSGDRQALLEAYHDGACCSINIPFFTQNNNRNNLSDYFKDSRNLKKQKDPIMRYKLLKHTRLNVVAFLNELPKTLHDVNSFMIDITTQTTTLLCFSVHGIFKEVEGKFRDSLRAFNRVFIVVPAANSGLCIVNDQLHVRQATQEETRKAFVTPAPTPSSSPVPTLPSTQQEMLQAFSLQSGMNLEWSQKCLIDNDWDFARAAQIFTQLKLEDKIPDEAFLK